MLIMKQCSIEYIMLPTSARHFDCCMPAKRFSVQSLNESEADGQAGGQFWIAVKTFKEKIPYLFRSSSIIISLAVRCWI